MAKQALVYSKKTGKKHRIPSHWVDHPVLGAPFEKTPRQRDAEKAAAAGTAGGSPADHPDEVPAAQPTPQTAPPEESDTSEPVAKKTGSNRSTETPATRGEE